MFNDPFFLVGSTFFVITLIFFIYCLSNKNINNWSNRHFFLYSLILSALFLSSFFIYGQYSVENYNVQTLAAKTIVAHQLKGQVLTWFDGRAFGTPFPLIPSLDKHPLIYVAHFLNNRVFYASFYLLHLTAGCFFFLLICKRLGLSHKLSLLSGFLFVFSTLNVSDILDNDWPSMALCNCMLPILFLIILDFPKYANKNRFVFALPLLLAFVFYGGHPAVYVKYLPFFVLFTCFSFMYARRELNTKNLAAIFFLSVFLVLPRIYHIQHEMSYFPDTLSIYRGGPYDLLSAKGIMNHLVPFWGMQPSPQFNLIPKIFQSSSPPEILELIARNFSLHSSRTPFIGLPYFLISIVVGAFIICNSRNDYLSVVKKLIIISFVLAMIMMHSPNSWFLGLIHPWTCRDLFIFFGILSGGLAIKHLSTKLPDNYRWVIYTILFLQLTQHIGYVGNNIFFKAGDPRQTGGKHLANFLNAPEKESPLVEWLKNNRDAYGNRVLLSPLIEEDLANEAAVLAKEGFYVPADISYHTGINIVNEHYLKGISLYPIQPQTYPTQGKILLRNDYSVIKRNELLDLSSIGWILMKSDEFQKQGPFSGLFLATKFSFAWKDEEWIVLANRATWNRAYLLSHEILDVTLEKKYCVQKSLFCNDLTDVKQYKINSLVNRIGNNGKYEFSFDAQGQNTILGISTMYRPEWVASSNNNKLKMFPLFDGFIGVEIPRNTNKIELSYVDNVREKLMILSFLTFLLCIFGVFFNRLLRYVFLVK